VLPPPSTSIPSVNPPLLPISIAPLQTHKRAVTDSGTAEGASVEARRLKKAKYNSLRPKLSDYKHRAGLHAVLSLACDLMKVDVATTSPYLDDEQLVDLPKKITAEALSRQDVQETIVIDDRMLKLVSFLFSF